MQYVVIILFMVVGCYIFYSRKGYMKSFLFLLFILLAGVGYYYSEKNQLLSVASLKALVIEKKDGLCAMPELLEQYHISENHCRKIFVLKAETCIEKVKGVLPEEEFTSKDKFLNAFNGTLNCIIDAMKI